MKTKKLVKRLSLGKTTIANLGDKEQREVKGGYWATAINTGCGTWHPACPSMPVWRCPYTDIKCTNAITEAICECI